MTGKPGSLPPAAQLRELRGPRASRARYPSAGWRLVLQTPSAGRAAGSVIPLPPPTCTARVTSGWLNTSKAGMHHAGNVSLRVPRPQPVASTLQEACGTRGFVSCLYQYEADSDPSWGGGRPSDIAVGSPPRMTEKDFGGQSSFKPITSLPNLPF